MSLLHHDARREALAQLSCFRGEFYACLTARSDALFELADAVLCGDGPVRSPAELSLVGEHRRGHGGLYAAVARGRIDAGRLRRALAAVPLPRAADGRLVLAVDVTCWLRPDAHTSPERILCHTYGRGKDQHIPIPGWPYSIICALEPGRSSWTAPLDALRLRPGDDTATVTARQLRDLLQRLITAGQWRTGDPDILIVADAGYDAPRLGFLLKDLPVQVLARMRSDRVLRRAVPPRLPHTQGRPPRHGGEFVFGQPDTWGTPDTETVADTRLYGTARARSWDRLHPKLTHRSSWAAADGTLPIVEGTVIRLDIGHLPSGATPKPVWLWWSGTNATPADADRLWQAYLRLWNGVRWRGGCGAVPRRRRGLCGAGSSWRARAGRPIRMWPPNSARHPMRWDAGGLGVSSTGSPAWATCHGPADPGRSPTSRSPPWSPGHWRAPRRTQLTGRRGQWPRHGRRTHTPRAAPQSLIPARR
ncbi:hypothetical protein GCM10011579_004670 [Streptomyces albiflavescens]|uniref:Transposase IS701-like DDE domain-containing protein n=1 Tax=Streptomyces albiflavescens TaxID=1623582 RepID=A0A917XRS9_9ACTN|nr:hypothetical protein GCM10011579_004670 [Streptomyces albiflavescens]